MVRERKHQAIKVGKVSQGKHNWVCQAKYNFSLGVNYCTETGDIEVHTDLPLEKEQLDVLIAKLREGT